MTWQVASLGEVSNAVDWFNAKGVRISRVGRDMPGSNWHCYPYDPEGHRNEIYYGMEQIGWTGRSKPQAMRERAFRKRWPHPQMPESQTEEKEPHQGAGFKCGIRKPAKVARD